MPVNSDLIYRANSRIAVTSWSNPDENAMALRAVLNALGHKAQTFLFDQPFPENVDISMRDNTK